MARFCLPTLLLQPSTGDYVVYPGTTSYAGHGGVEIDTDATALLGATPASCERRCDSDSFCDCVSFRASDGKCWKRSLCVPEQFGSDSAFDTYVKHASPTPPPPPMPSTKTFWKVKRGDLSEAGKDPQLLLSVDGSAFAPFQLRGFDYSPIDTCCGNNDFSVFQRPLWSRDIPRMAAMGANAIKLYGICDGVTDSSNYCGLPNAGCNLTRTTVADVRAFLDFALEYKMFVLLANRNSPGNVDAYRHMVATYGAHPAVAGVIIYDEALDYDNFNAAAKVAHEGFCSAQGLDPESTSVEENGRIITTAMLSFNALDAGFQSKYGEYVSGWGFDPYALFNYEDYRQNWATPGKTLAKLPYKPFFIMETGFNGPVEHWPAQVSNYGCRNDCVGKPDCFACEDFADNWKAFVKQLGSDRLAAQFVFEWTDENWKNNPDPCSEVTHASRWDFGESNHGIFHVTDGPQGSPLIPKNLGNGETFESVLKAVWTSAAPGAGGYRGWLDAPSLVV
jgi:hypothetical protein